jgi:hypothetical protein
MWQRSERDEDRMPFRPGLGGEETADLMATTVNGGDCQTSPATSTGQPTLAED